MCLSDEGSPSLGLSKSWVNSTDPQLQLRPSWQQAGSDGQAGPPGSACAPESEEGELGQHGSTEVRPKCARGHFMRFLPQREAQRASNPAAFQTLARQLHGQGSSGDGIRALLT